MYVTLCKWLQTEIDDEDDDDGGEVGYSNTSSNEMRLKVGKTSTGSTADDTEEVMGEFNFLSNPDAVDNMKRDNAEDGKGDSLTQEIQMRESKQRSPVSQSRKVVLHDYNIILSSRFLW